TSVRAFQPQAAGPEARRSGLFLLQFTNRYDAAWHDPLAARGVELVQYVPDNGFVVSLSEGRLGEVPELPFVRWVCPFANRPKVHPSVSRQLATLAPGTAINLKVMVSASAKPVEIAALGRNFQAVSYHRSPHLGTVVTGRIAPARLARLIRSR